MQRTMRTLVALAFSAAFLPAVAAERTGSGGYEAETETGSETAVAMPRLEQADRNGSGSVEISEATGIAGLDMSAADTDRDGKLSRSEYESAKQSHEKGTRGMTPEPGGQTR